jgi:hypothetical protein
MKKTAGKTPSTAAPNDDGYAKISATLERKVLRQIKEQTENVSGYLNEAAKRQLYFDMLRRSVEELERQGVEFNTRFYDNLGKWLNEVDMRKLARERRKRRASASR